MAKDKKPAAKPRNRKSAEESIAIEPQPKGFKSLLGRIRARIQNLLRRRPHRSFKRTHRRDYNRSLKLPGYWALTNEVRAILWKNKRIFIMLALIYALVSFIVVGIASQETYKEYSEALRESGGKLFQGSWWEVGQAGILLLTGVMGSLNDSSGDVGRMTAVILGLMVWLTTVWLLRAIMAGKKPYLRDGLYNASAPLLSTFFVFLVGAIQLLPVALAAIAFGAASSSGLINEGIEAMVFWIFEILLLTLSLYWITSTLFGLIVVTLPGMYPLHAIRTAGDLVIGRRVRIFLRFMWVIGLTVVLWAVVMIPLILVDAWIKSVLPAIDWLPLIPVLLLIVASASVVWVSAYIYIFYRKVVDDDAAPA